MNSPTLASTAPLVRHRVLIVDDHALIRMGLRALLETASAFELCGEAESATQALALAAQTRPALAIVDISLRGNIDGIELTRLLLEAHPGLRILILSMHAESGYVRRALAAGARGYLTKNDVPTLLIKALHTLQQGDIFLDEVVRAYAE